MLNELCPEYHEFHEAVQTLENLHKNEASHDGDIGLSTVQPMAATVRHDAETKEEIENELEGAEKYYRQYLETKDTGYNAMAKDELKHARMTTIDPTAQAKIQHYTDRYNVLLNKLSSGG